MRRAEAEQQGRRAEWLAAWWLRLQGWRILAQRVKLKAGEVDLIARKGRTVAFIEVKWRKDAWQLSAAIDAHRLRRVARAAEILGGKYTGPKDDLRIDVILMAPGKWPHRIANAWQPGA